MHDYDSDEIKRLTAITERLSASAPSPDAIDKLPDAVIDKALMAFNSGLVVEPSKTNPRGYITRYWPRIAMRNAVKAIFDEIEKGKANEPL